MSRRLLVIPAVLILAGLAVFLAGPSGEPQAARMVPVHLALPSTRVCSSPSAIAGPARAPKGSIRVPAGSNANVNFGRAHKIFWFAPGVHTLGKGEYHAVLVGSGSTYIGAPGAVLNGQFANESAFGGEATHVTVEDLTIKNFVPPGDQGAVNHDAAPHWVLRRDVIEDNAPGAGVMMGTDDAVVGSCITKNGQYGINGYVESYTSEANSLTHGPSNLVLEGNEISYNGTCDWEKISPNPTPKKDRPGNCAGAGEYDGCGCSGGAKFWRVDGALIRDNFVYHNYYVGLWVDTDNTGFNILDNDIAQNWAEGLMYEISYNARIQGNEFVNNAWGEGPYNTGFPTGAIYVSESGGSPRVPGRDSGLFRISKNAFYNNWSGVILWENSNRFCGSPDFPGVCTLVAPRTANLVSCTVAKITGSKSLNALCRWKTQNVKVENNVFDSNERAIPGCHGVSNSCGENGVFSEYGSVAPFRGDKVPEAITFHQKNLFADNRYSTGWMFMVYQGGDVVSFSTWRHQYHQDPGSKVA